MSLEKFRDFRNITSVHSIIVQLLLFFIYRIILKFQETEDEGSLLECSMRSIAEIISDIFGPIPIAKFKNRGYLE